MTHGNDPTLPDLVAMIWAARVRVLIGAVLGLVIAFFFVAAAVPQYRISMLVAPADRGTKADVKSLLPDNPSFALQYLVNTVGSQDSTDFMRFENTILGPTIAGAVQEKFGDRLANGMDRACRMLFSCGGYQKSPEAMAEVLSRKIRIDPVGNTPLRRISFDHPDGDFGVWLLGVLYAQADGLIRADVADKAMRRKDYLQDVIDRTNHPDHRRALTSLLMEQEHILMILAMDEPFAAVIAEKPSISAKPVWPRKSLVFFGFAAACGLLAFAAGRGSGKI